MCGADSLVVFTTAIEVEVLGVRNEALDEEFAGRDWACSNAFGSPGSHHEAPAFWLP